MMAFLIYILIFMTSAVLVLKMYFKYRIKWCKSKTCLVGKTVIVTGANTGIGYEASLEFAKRGARVILACRNKNKAEEARKIIVKETLNENIVVKVVNMASLNSVRDFAKDVSENEKRLDILVNNAGVGALKQKKTEDGLEVLMQVNYFGPVLLTVLLIDLLKKSSPCRIVNVSSLLASRARLTIENLNKSNGPYLNYCNSKLGNILFTMKLSTLLRRSNINVFSIHPGAINTQIFNSLRGTLRILLEYFLKFYFKTPEEGAQTTLYTALEQGIELYSGKHFAECAVTETYETAKNALLMESIWDKTMKLIDCEEISRKLSNY